MRTRMSTVIPGGIVLCAMRLFGQTLGPSPAGGVDTSVTQDQQRQMETSDGPTSIRYKGLSFTPGGFLEGAFVLRTRNENADINDSYTGVPLNGSTNAKLSEFRGSARDSRLSLLFEGNFRKTQLSGYFEIDFLGAAPTANYVQTSAFTPRLRQAWLQVKRPSGWIFAGGQLWTLMTTHRRGIETRAEFIPSTADGSYAVGFNYTRGRAFRVTKNLHDKVWLGLELEEAESTYSAASVPANVMGLNTSQNTSTGVLLLPFLPNYSNGHSTPMAPDLAAKVAVEPGWGHFEIKGLGRFFRDRIASTENTVGQLECDLRLRCWLRCDPACCTEQGGYHPGRSRRARHRPIRRRRIAGRHVGPRDGRMLPLRTADVLGGIEAHPGKKLDTYGYLGNEYVGRYAAVTATGGPAGYGSPLVSYRSCTNEVAVNTCSGANRNVQEATAGYWYRIFKGPFGTVQYGNQVAF